MDGKEFPYPSLIWSLLYFSTHTGPDIMFLMGFFSRLVESSKTAHWVAAKPVLRHLQGGQEIRITNGAVTSG